MRLTAHAVSRILRQRCEARIGHAAFGGSRTRNGGSPRLSVDNPFRAPLGAPIGRCAAPPRHP
jgi:hypothetical protein